MLACALCAGSAAAAEVLVNSRIGSDAGFWQAEPSIAVAGDTVVIGFNDTRYRDAHSGYAYSTDGGATWTDGSPLPRAGGGDRTLGDPALVACAGVFFYASLYFRPGFGSAVSVSRGTVTDGRLVWNAPRIAASAIDIDPQGRNVLDKEYIACDPATGTLYVAYTRAVPGLTDGKERIELVRSDTDGDTWSEPIAVTSFSPRHSGRLGAIPAVGVDGAVYVAWANIVNTGRLIRTRNCELGVSSDGGGTFPMRKRIPGCGARPAPGTRLQLPVLTADPQKRGVLYVAYAAGDHGHGDIFMTRSTTGGRTFRRPVRVTVKTRGVDQFMPWIAVDRLDGEPTVVWYDRRVPPRNASLDVFFAQSVDGGRRFGPNTRLTSISTDVNRIGPGIGVDDYLNIVSDGTRAYVAWADGRNGDYDIYFSVIQNGSVRSVP